MQVPGGIVGELGYLVLDEFGNGFLGGEFEMHSLALVELFEVVDEVLLVVGLDDIVGQGTVPASDLHGREQEGVVEYRIPGVVHPELDGRAFLLEGHGEEGERGADGEIVVADQASFYEGIGQIEVEGSLLPLVAADLPDDLVDAFECLGVLFGFGVAQIDDPLVSEYETQGLGALAGDAGVEGILLAGLGLEEETVRLADVDELLLQFPQGLGQTAVDGGTLGGSNRIFLGDCQESGSVLFHETVADSLDGFEILKLGRYTLCHLLKGGVAAYGRLPSAGIRILFSEVIPLQ